MPQKKIAVLANTRRTVGGAQMISAFLANTLAARGYDVTFIPLFTVESEPVYELSDGVKEADPVLSVPPLGIKSNFLKILRALRKYFSKSEYDVIISSLIGVSPMLELSAPKKTKTIYWDHQGFDVGRTFGAAWLGRRVAAKFADGIVCLTKKSLGEYDARVSRPGKAKCIYNPLTLPKREMPYNAESKVISSCGKIIGQKGFDMLPDIAKIVFEKHPDWQWHIYGDIQDPSPITKKIERYGLEKNVLIKGFAPELDSIYTDKAMFALTSRHEGLPMVITNAQYYRLPVVSFDCPTGPAEMIRDGENGFLVPPGDIPAMAEKILSLIENPEMRKGFSQKSLADIDSFSLETFTDSWCEAIEGEN